MNKKLKLKYWVDILMGLSFIIVAITGIMKWSGTLKQLAFQRESRHLVTLIHDYTGLLMILLVLIHLILNWKWIISMTKNVFSKKNKQ